MGNNHSYEVIVDFNNEELFIVDANDHGKVLEPKEYSANSNEEFLRDIAENNPDYADYINSHIPELSKAIDRAVEFISREAADIERERLIAEMTIGGGYGEDTADAKAEARIEELDGAALAEEHETRFDAAFKPFLESAQLGEKQKQFLERARKTMEINGFEHFGEVFGAPAIRIAYGTPEKVYRLFGGEEKYREIEESVNAALGVTEQTFSDEPEQLSLFDTVFDPDSTSEKKEYIDKDENPEVAKAVNALKEYARSTILYYDSKIREAFLNSSRKEFDAAVTDTVSKAITDFISGEITSDLAESKDFLSLFGDMYDDDQFAQNVFADISDILYAEHKEIDKARQTAHNKGLPYDEYPYDSDEGFDPYAYNPNRMSDEDYDRMHELMDAERTEAEKLIDKTVHIEDRNYIVEGIISNGSDGFLAKLHAEPTDKFNIASVIYEDWNVVQEMLERQEKQEKYPTIFISEEITSDLAESAEDETEDEDMEF